jgi:hypothetical protein
MIRTLRYRRVVRWRYEHVCPPPDGDVPAHDVTAGADTSLAWTDHDYHRPTVGFSPNGN